MLVSRVFVGTLSAVAFIACSPSAAADGPGDVAVCHGTVESGVEVDTCTGNPNPPDDANSPGNNVRVVPQLCFGLGFGGCDD